MPLIPNYIARFRTHSQSTASSHSGSRSNSTAGPATPGPEFARLGLDPPVQGSIVPDADSNPQAQVARKIHPDINALLDETITPVESVVVVEDSGPRPPRRQSRSMGQLVGKRPEAVPEKEAGDEGAQRTDTKGAGEMPETSASPRSPFLSRFLSTPLLGTPRSLSTTDADFTPEIGGSSTHWSTFGRHRPLVSPPGEFGSLQRRESGSKSSSRSKRSIYRKSRVSAPATPSTTRTPSRVQTAEDSPVATLSSSSGSKSYSQRSRRHPLTNSPPRDPQTPLAMPYEPLSHFMPVPAIVSPQTAKPHLDGSPETFGRRTPKVIPYPALSGTFSPPRTSTPPPPEYRIVPSTFPQRSRKQPPENSSNSSISFPSFPLKPFARSRTQSQSRPRAEDIFPDPEHGVRLRLLGEEADDMGRRTSADWMAAEAVRSGSAAQGETWPATVSREMVRLSLRGRGHLNAAPVLVSAGDDNDVTEGGEVGLLKEKTKNPTLFGSTGEDRRHFFRASRRKIPNTAPSADISAAPTSQLAVLASTHSAPPPPELSVPVFQSKTRAQDEKQPPEASVTGLTPSRTNAPSDPGPSKLAGNLGIVDGVDASTSHGKRKNIESEDEATPNELITRGILLSRRETSNRVSDASHAPSSFRHAKRIRLSTPSHSPPHDHLSRSVSMSLRRSPSISPPPSRPSSSLRTLPINPRSLSQTSIPIRAIVSPRPPSIDRRSEYHMRDPALPLPRRQSTQWTGGARKPEGAEELRRTLPLQGWAFIVGFVIFPLWWIAAVAPVGWGWGWTKGLQDGKGAWSEEDLAAREVMEYDVAYTWRQRCRLMSLLGLFVYVPLVVLLAVLVPRA